MTRHSPLSLAVLALLALGACKQPPSSRPGEKTLRVPVRARINGLDPVHIESTYQGSVESAIFDTLLQYRYPRRPFELQPNLVTAMPTVSEDGLRYDFELRGDVYFQDDPAFATGKGRLLTVDDVFYSIKRSCDARWSPNGYWLLQGRISGLDEYKASEAERRHRFAEEGREDEFVFDYEAEVAGLLKHDERRFSIVLTKPFPQFLYVLAMAYTAVVPREAVEAYGHEFAQRPVGSGPFMVEEIWRGAWIKLRRNPNYRDERVPTDLNQQELAAGLGAYAGQRVPFLDRIVFEVFEQDQPMWLKFRAGDLDMTQVPAEYWPVAFDKDWSLKPWALEEGIQNHNLPLLDLIYWGFNMQDPVFGTPPEMKWVRQAIAYAVDLEERNTIFYNGTNTLYQGPLPPGLEGYVPGHRKRDLDKARELLARAGYPDGKGLPVLHYESSRGGNNKEQGELFKRQLRAIGLEVDVSFNSFPELTDKLDKKKAQFFGLAWGADYPDAENFLQLFYGPNAAPGSNNFNYQNPEYDRLYQQIATMLPGPERTAIYRQMRDIILEDQPMIGSMARTRFYIWNPRLRNFKPEEVYDTWWKYLDVVEPAAVGAPVAER